GVALAIILTYAGPWISLGHVSCWNKNNKRSSSGRCRQAWRINTLSPVTRTIQHRIAFPSRPPSRASEYRLQITTNHDYNAQIFEVTTTTTIMTPPPLLSPLQRQKYVLLGNFPLSWP